MPKPELQKFFRRYAEETQDAVVTDFAKTVTDIRHRFERGEITPEKAREEMRAAANAAIFGSMH